MRTPTTALTVAFAVLFGLSATSAQQPSATGQRQQTDRQAGQANAQQAQIPKMLKSLDLSDEQEQQIKQICARFDNELSQAADKFDKLHKQAVMLEAAWASALESQMDDTQKQKFRQEREKAKREGTRSEVYYRGEPSESQQPGQQRPQPERQGQPAQPERQNQQAQPESQRPGQAARPAQQGTQPTAQTPTGQASGRLLIITITSPRQYYTSAGLSEEQQRKCDKLCEAFHQEIGATWKQLHSLHQQMVKTEMEKMSAIEKVLTKEQLEQLKKQHEQFETSIQDTSTPDGQLDAKPNPFRNRNNPDNNQN